MSKRTGRYFIAAEAFPATIILRHSFLDTRFEMKVKQCAVTYPSKTRLSAGAEDVHIALEGVVTEIVETDRAAEAMPKKKGASC